MSGKHNPSWFPNGGDADPHGSHATSACNFTGNYIELTSVWHLLSRLQTALHALAISSLQITLKPPSQSHNNHSAACIHQLMNTKIAWSRPSSPSALEHQEYSPVIGLSGDHTHFDSCVRCWRRMSHRRLNSAVRLYCKQKENALRAVMAYKPSSFGLVRRISSTER